MPSPTQRILLETLNGQHDTYVDVSEAEPLNVQNSCEPRDTVVNKLTDNVDFPDQAWKAGRTMKVLVTISALLPLPLCLYLLYRINFGAGITGSPLQFVENNRASLQIIVSLLSAMLSIMNVFVRTTILKFMWQVRFMKSYISMTDLKFFEAIVSRHFGVDHPGTRRLSLLIILLSLPSFLWVGPLTPVLTTETTSIEGGLQIPAYSNASGTNWDNNDFAFLQDCTSYVEYQVMFSKCPAASLSGQLLTSASQASITKQFNSLHLQAKNDNTQYSYAGRSYGVGSSVGFQSFSHYSTSNITSYSYFEPGYQTSVRCIHNSSSQWHLQEVTAGNAGAGIPWIYYAIGTFPNTHPGAGAGFFSVTGLGGDASIVALETRVDEGQHVIQLAAGENYSYLNQTQCWITYAPTLFQVDVTVFSRIIIVRPIVESQFDPTGGLAATGTYQLGAVGRINTSLYISLIGQALKSNIDLYRVDNFTALADSMAAMIDDILVFVGSAQYYITQDTQKTNVAITYNALKLGKARYIYATCAVCIVLLLLATVVDLIRTHWWRQLPRFDFTDMPSVITGSAIAGKQIMRFSNEEKDDSKRPREFEVNSDILLRLGSVSVSMETVAGGSKTREQVAAIGMVPPPLYSIHEY
ncbi:hypothetical protein BO94DRAFT_621297 [Aspergillus sclerotioniger CBS 115572]|uniref:Uncharacterized protein n=1 Tax=Aspergillus sclerotioniger CBS 115572 TaxID=1450535 RepID=A0A317XE66_9EURO|nr:hypothetical protein BO94DRAFT_621297 [Aspergillus sclerotioniger CBS 115572]PWY94850.1 hypothetical protein BO94DRAFT_621297 [Aspergillus sclerotioniger CBS 115572]